MSRTIRPTIGGINHKSTSLKINQRELHREIELIIFLHHQQARRLLAAVDNAMEYDELEEAVLALRAAKQLITQLEGREIVAMLRKDLEE